MCTTRKTGWFWASVSTGVAVLLALAPGAAVAASFAHLRPGAPARLAERVPVNYVFVGIEPDEISRSSFLGELPRSYEPIERMPSFYGRKAPLGITYTYDHNVVFADREYENRLFRTLKKLAKPAPLTTYQTRYNAQPGVLDIDSNHLISAPKVELWLAQNPPTGVDIRRDTIFFIDWYGRDDFRFHLYQKVGEAKPDTGTDYGTSDERKMIAWGGTAADDPEDGHGVERRVWFYDLSAGPEYWTGNWNVTTDDASPADGNVDRDVRIPPSWEYAETGFRSPKMLTADLGKLARYVGIDLLFTPSPLYPVGIDGPTLPRSVEFDMNFYDLPGATASTSVQPQAIVSSLERLAPWLSLSATVDGADMAESDHARCYAQWSLVPAGPSCYPSESHTSDASLFLYHSKNADLFFDESSDHEAGSFNYQTAGGTSDCFAFAGDDYRTGRQGFVYSFIGPRCQDTIGFTDLLAHEYGHHVGMSHPHDGYDSEEKRHFAAQQGSFNFAWSGTEVNSVMSYTNHNNEFSQFDEDNMARWATAAYLAETNRIAAALLAEDVPASRLRSVDRLVEAASTSFAHHRYRSAVTAAIDAFDLAVQHARSEGVKLTRTRSAMADGVRSMEVPREILLDPISPSGAFER